MIQSIDFTTLAGILFALFILVFGGISISIGRSAALLANRIRPLRFFLALIGEGLFFALSVMLWSLSIFAILNLILNVQASIGLVIGLVAISHTPYLLGFLIFIPYLGYIWHHILRLIVFFTLLVLVGGTFNVTFWSALIACGLGGLILELLVLLKVLDPARWQEKLLRKLTGKAELFTTIELADQLAEETRLANNS